MLPSTRGGEDARLAEWNPGRVICIGSSSVVWQILDTLIGGDSCPGQLIVASANETPAGLAELCGRAAPALLVGDEAALVSPSVSGLRSLIDRQAIQLIVFSDCSEDSAYERFFQMGCAGVLPLTVSQDTLRKALHAISKGELWMPRRILSKLARVSSSAAGEGKLTRRESDILKLIRLGKTNQQIAEELFISRETVRWHVRGLYSKIGSATRPGTVVARMEALAFS